MSFTRTLGRRARLTVSASRRPSSRGRSARRRWSLAPRLRLVLALCVVLAGLLLGAWLWVRDSSLVAVNQVTITGNVGSEAPAIGSALRSAARNMTTLDVQMGPLRTAVAPFPEVLRLRVRTIFPHRMVIDVVEQRPVAVVEVAGRQVAVAADGTILRSAAISSTLPMIPLSVLPVGPRLSSGQAADAVALLAAAPYQFLSRISQVTTDRTNGLVAQLRNGPSIYFGDRSRLLAKWAAVTAVLGDPSSAGAAYIDVTDPSRPAAGAGSPAASSGAGSPAGSSGAGSPAASSGAGSAAAPATSSGAAAAPQGQPGSG